MENGHLGCWGGGGFYYNGVLAYEATSAGYSINPFAQMFDSLYRQGGAQANLSQPDGYLDVAKISATPATLYDANGSISGLSLVGGLPVTCDPNEAQDSPGNQVTNYQIRNTLLAGVGTAVAVGAKAGVKGMGPAGLLVSATGFANDSLSAKTAQEKGDAITTLGVGTVGGYICPAYGVLYSVGDAIIPADSQGRSGWDAFPGYWVKFLVGGN